MNAELSTKLARIANRSTRYEIIAFHATDYRSILIGYTGRKSFSGMLAMLRQNGPKFVSLTGMTDDTTNKRERGALHFSNGWTVRFSGRTQRDAYIDGERPFIGSIESLEVVA